MSEAELKLGKLSASDTFEGFNAFELVSGLYGVCAAINSALVDGAKFENHEGTMSGLAMAAKVLSSILHTEAYS